MQDAPALTEQDFDEIVATPSPLFCPAVAGIKQGQRFHLWAKVGGQFRLVNVIAASDPYQKGPKALYIRVFGYGIKERAVNVKKLRLPKGISNG